MLSAVLGVGVPMVARLVEKLLGRGKGDTKKTVALDILTAIVGQFGGPGVGLPGAGELGDLLENAVAALNKNGALVGESTTIDAKQIDQELFQAAMLLLRKSGALP
jgi:hypothetical protein